MNHIMQLTHWQSVGVYLSRVENLQQNFNFTAIKITPRARDRFPAEPEVFKDFLKLMNIMDLAWLGLAVIRSNFIQSTNGFTAETAKTFLFYNDFYEAITNRASNLKDLTLYNLMLLHRSSILKKILLNSNAAMSIEKLTLAGIDIFPNQQALIIGYLKGRSKPLTELKIEQLGRLDASMKKKIYAPIEDRLLSRFVLRMSNEHFARVTIIKQNLRNITYSAQVCILSQESVLNSERTSTSFRLPVNISNSFQIMTLMRYLSKRSSNMAHTFLAAHETILPARFRMYISFVMKLQT